MAKKSFKEHPVFQYISKEVAADVQGEAAVAEQDELAEQPVEKVSQSILPTGHKRRESKSRRLQLLVTPTLFAKIKAAAEAGGYSINEYSNLLLEQGTKEG